MILLLILLVLLFHQKKIGPTKMKEVEEKKKDTTIEMIEMIILTTKGMIGVIGEERVVLEKEIMMAEETEKIKTNVPEAKVKLIKEEETNLIKMTTKEMIEMIILTTKGMIGVIGEEMIVLEREITTTGETEVINTMKKKRMEVQEETTFIVLQGGKGKEIEVMIVTPKSSQEEILQEEKKKDTKNENKQNKQIKLFIKINYIRR